MRLAAHQGDTKVTLGQNHGYLVKGNRRHTENNFPVGKEILTLWTTDIVLKK